MSIIRLRDMTPEIYSQESRDFQLLCRLYDAVFNGLKFDTDTITTLIDTPTCRSNMLQLLESKVGFFTEKKIDSDKLRYILESFPILVRNKGSLRAIKETLFLFLRMYSVTSDLDIYYLKTPYDPPFSVDNPCVLSSGKLPEPNSVVILIKSFYKRPDTTVLEEIFKYILPAGINYYIEFAVEAKLEDLIVTSEDKAQLLFVTDNINSALRGSDTAYSSVGYTEIELVDLNDTFNYTAATEDISTTNQYVLYLVNDEGIMIPVGVEYGIAIRERDVGYSFLNTHIGAINTMETISSDSFVSTKFIGYYPNEQSATEYVQTLQDKTNIIAVINYTENEDIQTKSMIYSNSRWTQINFVGNVKTKPASPHEGDLIYLNETSWSIYLNNRWVDTSNFARYIINTTTIEG